MNSDVLSFLRFDCPCGCAIGTGVAFTPALDGSPVPPERKPWRRVSGSTLEDISLEPSVLVYPAPTHGCKGWHGYVTNGELRAC